MRREGEVAPEPHSGVLPANLLLLRGAASLDFSGAQGSRVFVETVSRAPVTWRRDAKVRRTRNWATRVFCRVRYQLVVLVNSIGPVVGRAVGASNPMSGVDFVILI